MEDIYDNCLIHGPGWFSEIMMIKDPFCKTGRSRKDRLIWPCVFIKYYMSGYIFIEII